jgi:hypothetical protein
VAGDTTIRSKIHGLWESFFPSTIYFVVFVAIALFSFGFEHAAELSRAGQFDDYASSKLYLLLKDLELLKLVPIAAVFAFAFLVYVFDRLAMMVGNALPPFPVWHGSTALRNPTFLPCGLCSPTRAMSPHSTPMRGASSIRRSSTRSRFPQTASRGFRNGRTKRGEWLHTPRPGLSGPCWYS